MGNLVPRVRAFSVSREEPPYVILRQKLESENSSSCLIMCVDYGFGTWAQRVTAVTAGSPTDFTLFFMLTERDRDSGNEVVDKGRVVSLCF